MRIGATLLACCVSWLALGGGLAAQTETAKLADSETTEPSSADLSDQLAQAPEGALVADANAEGQADSNLEAQAAVSDRVDVRSFAAPSVHTPLTHLFGDWNGLYPRMTESGITPTVTWVSDIAGNPVGGRKQGFAECDNLGIDFLADLEKIYGIEDARFHISMSQRSGQSLSKEYIDNSFNVQQVWGGETFKMLDFEYAQRYCDGHLSVHAGRMAAGDDFLTSPYYWIFVQNGICGNPVGIFKNAPGMTAYPNTNWGVRARLWMLEDRAYWITGVYNGDATTRDNNDHGMDWSMRGPAFVISEAAYQFNGKPKDKGLLGTYKLGAWYDGDLYTNFNGQVLGDAAPQFGLSADQQRGNWGFYGLADQMLFETNSGETQKDSKTEEKRGLGVFTSLLVSPDQAVSEMPFFCNGGVVIHGPFQRRPGDLLAFAVVYGNYSDDLRNAQRLAQTTDSNVKVKTYETVLEWSYRFRLRQGAAYFQPDLQYVINPGGTGEYENAFVVGCQVGMNF